MTISQYDTFRQQYNKTPEGYEPAVDSTSLNQMSKTQCSRALVPTRWRYCCGFLSKK